MGEQTVVASISGGKDSAALSLWLTEQGIEHRRVFADTGWEHPETLEYLQGPLQDKIGHINIVKSPIGGFSEWCIKKAMFPSRLARYCTTKLKIEPLAEYMAELCGAIVNAVGVRAAESRSRAKLPEREPWDMLDGVEVWRPLISWTEADVIAMHHKHGLAPNPLYLRGSERVGCWPCINCRKGELRLVADSTPWRIDEIRELEDRLYRMGEERYAAKGETYESLGYNRPTFFHNHSATAPSSIAIDEAVAWSRTSRGGRQVSMFSTEEPTCVRWGMCGA